jgi:hypothetical protein
MLLNALTTQRGDSAPFGMDPVAISTRIGVGAPDRLVNGLLDLLVDGDVPAQVRDSLVDYVAAGGGLSPGSATFDRSIRGAVHLIMSTPVYQMA